MNLQTINHLFKWHTINYTHICSLVKLPNNVSIPQNILKSHIKFRKWCFL